MEYTGYEKLTDEEIEVKLRKIEDAKYNLEREKRHRKEAAEKEKYKDVLGKYFALKNDPDFVLKVTAVDKDGMYIGKTILCMDRTSKTLLPSQDDLSFHIVYDYPVGDITEWEPMNEEDVKKWIDGIKRKVDIYVKF